MVAESVVSFDQEELARLVMGWPGSDLARANLAIDVVRDGPDHPPNAPCQHTYAYRPSWAVDGCRRLLAIGPTFDSPRAAATFLGAFEAELAKPDPAAATCPGPGAGPDASQLPPAQLLLPLSERGPAQT